MTVWAIFGGNVILRPLYEWLVSVIQKSGRTTDPERVAASLWVALHGIAVLSSTGALELTRPGLNVVEMIRHTVRNTGC